MSAKGPGGRFWVAVVPVLAVLIGLGTWQLQRRTWKEGLLAAISARAALAPANSLSDLPCRPEAGLDDPCEFRPIELQVTFDHGSERHVFISVPVQPNGVGGPGFWVFARAALADGRMVYVNRGFVPERLKSPGGRLPGQVEGPVTLTGLLRRAEVRGLFSGVNDTSRNVFFVRAPTEFVGMDAPEPRPRPNLEFASRLNFDYYIDQTGPAVPGGLPMPMVGRVAIPNRHLEYALTWYALALTLIAVALVFRRQSAGQVNDR